MNPKDSMRTPEEMLLLEEIASLTFKLSKLQDVLEFYANDENWAACQPEDTKDTCTHFIGELSGGDRAKQILKEVM